MVWQKKLSGFKQGLSLSQVEADRESRTSKVDSNLSVAKINRLLQVREKETFTHTNFDSSEALY